MSTCLIVLGVAMVAVSLVVRLLQWAIRIALPAGVLLVVIGVIWHLVGG